MNHRAFRHPMLTVIAAAAAVIAVPCTSALGAADDPVIHTISPDSVVEKPVPQPTITITGENLSVVLFQQPTLTITHTELPGVSFSAVMNVNFAGTEASVPGGLNHFNMLQMPLGEYDVIVERPDGASATVPGGFALIEKPAIDLEPGEIKMTVASRWGGPIKGMDLSEDGTIAYVANGRMFRVLDLSDESNPVELSSAYVINAYNVRVRDDYAFVAGSGHYGFSVFDISDIYAPELVWRANALSTSSATWADLEFYGDFAYMTNQNGIRIYDISDPLNVVQVHSGGSTLSGRIAIQGDNLFRAIAATQGQGSPVHVHDLTADPVNPPIVATWWPEDHGFPSYLGTRAITAEGDHLYLGGYPISWEGWLLTFDISDPANPVLTDFQDGFYRVTGLHAHNGRLYLADTKGAPHPPSWSQGLVTYDITTNAAQPDHLASYKSHSVSAPYEVFASDDSGRVYYYDHAEGLIILDVTDPAQPERLGHYHSPSSLWQMEKSDDNLFVLDRYGGVTVLDVADSASPQVIGHYLLESIDDIRAAGEAMALQGDLLYISAMFMGLEVVDVSNPANPIMVGEYRLDPDFPCWWLAGVTVDEHTIYVGWVWKSACTGFAIEQDRLKSLDGTDLGNISVLDWTLGSTDSDLPDVMIIHDDFLYATNHAGGSGNNWGHVYDISDPANLGTGEQWTPYYSRDLANVGSTLFTADRTFGGPDADNNGLRIREITSNPANPDLVMHINSGTAYYALDVQNDRLYAFRGNNLELFDVSDPVQPVALDALILGGGGGANRHSVLADEPNVFVTNAGTLSSPYGLTILDIHGLEPECSGVADLNCDGVVDVFDLLMVIGAWGECEDADDCPADITGPDNEPDGVVDVFDLLELVANWG